MFSTKSKRTQQVSIEDGHGKVIGGRSYDITEYLAGGRKDNLGKIIRIEIIHDCAVVERLGKPLKFYATPTAKRLAK